MLLKNKTYLNNNNANKGKCIQDVSGQFKWKGKEYNNTQ